MASLITTTPVTATYQSYQLAAFTDMAAAMNYIKAGGYYGSINLDPSGNWTMTIQHQSQNTSMTALIGDYILIKNNSIVSVVPQAQYASQYSP